MNIATAARLSLNRVSKNRAVGPEYKKQMRILGAVIALDRLLRGDKKGPFHVICSVEDYDHIGMATAGMLRAAGKVVRVSCFWSVHEVLSHTPYLDVAPIDRSYEERRTESEYDLVVAASAVGSVTAIETMLLRVLSEERRPIYRSIGLVSPFVYKTSLADLRRKLAADFDGQIAWYGYRVDKRLWNDGSPKPGLGKSGAARVGLDDAAAIRRFMPAEIRELIMRPRDPSPDSPPNPTGRGPRPDLGTGIDPAVLVEAGYLQATTGLDGDDTEHDRSMDRLAITAADVESDIDTRPIDDPDLEKIDPESLSERGDDDEPDSEPNADDPDPSYGDDDDNGYGP